MSAPRDIIDALECVLSVYFSGVRHNLRAAFILSDGLIELTCKGKVASHGISLKDIKFKPLLCHQHVALDPINPGLGTRCFENHNLRNRMHHVSAAATVDVPRCADAILDSVECIEHCFPGTKAALGERISIALRVVALYSTAGSARHRREFEKAMYRYEWRTDETAVEPNEVKLMPGQRGNWGLVILDEPADIETILIETDPALDQAEPEHEPIRIADPGDQGDGVEAPAEGREVGPVAPTSQTALEQKRSGTDQP